ncbi:MAG: hypothetical protein LUI12_09995 [Clostridiales bacterium]|nr:hypothetical protein [Clostridiales bacterium]
MNNPILLSDLSLSSSLGKWWDELIVSIMESVRECLREMITSNLEEAFADFNSNLDGFTQSLSKSPSQFNPRAFSTIVSLSKNAILPVAMVILAFIFVTELYEFTKDSNSGMGGFNQSKFIELMGMTVLFLFITVNAMDIAYSIFKIGAWAVQKAGASSPSLTVSSSIWADIAEEEDIGALISAVVTSFLIKLLMTVINVALTLCIYIRMFEIYIYLCAAPAPFATLQSRDWGETGKNYIRALIALAMQAFFMLAMIAVYGAVLGGMDTSGKSLSGALWECVAYCAMVVLMLFKAGSISKSIFNAH